MNKPRTRFAPSPTGYMHVGNLRTALYSYLLIKKLGGDFILRIEDTDRGRLVEGASDVIYSTLRETGLNWDEGPDIGGQFGPYIQSERQGIYMEYAKKLCETGEAYYCFCTAERLESLRGQSGGVAKYDRLCSSIPLSEALARVEEGQPFVIRQKMPQGGSTSFEDAVFGTITIENDELEDQILIKSDGMPTYNFANVIDDHLMKITHVVRGNEYLSSTPKYNLLYKAFGWDVPVYVHCSPIMKDAQNKLSKRNGDASYQDLVEKGYLKDAIINYIALLGWSPKGEREIFSLQELIEQFDIDGISKAPAVFDPEKLRYVNAEYIRAMTPEQFHDAALPFIKQAVSNENADTRPIAKCLHQRTEVLSEIAPQIDFIDTLGDYTTELFVNKKSKSTLQSSKEMLLAAIGELQKLKEFSEDAVHDTLISLAASLEVKNGLLMWPIRIAASGRTVTPGGAVEVLCILGKEESLRRLEIGLEKLNAALAEG
ncbi:MAG: glutamate--tRNA ligase [Oscillospiraceae bacterium]|nr:glutamate--tRNA ligase [Oscillospiraceae bacterium]